MPTADSNYLFFEPAFQKFQITGKEKKAEAAADAFCDSSPPSPSALTLVTEGQRSRFKSRISALPPMLDAHPTWRLNSHTCSLATHPSKAVAADGPSAGIWADVYKFVSAWKANPHSILCSSKLFISFFSACASAETHEVKLEQCSSCVHVHVYINTPAYTQPYLAERGWRWSC